MFKKGNMFSKGKSRLCYNCDEANHFTNKCPYEKRQYRERHDKEEMRPTKKLSNPKNSKVYKKRDDKALVVGETYMSNDSDNEDDVVGVAGVACHAPSKPGSVFRYDYSKDYRANHHVCLMARKSKVLPIPNPPLFTPKLPMPPNVEEEGDV